MPRLFKIGTYIVFFWSNENEPLEPVHVHVCEGAPRENATKIWITRAGKCVLASRRTEIDSFVLRNLMRIIEARSLEVIMKWKDFFGSADFIY